MALTMWLRLAMAVSALSAAASAYTQECSLTGKVKTDQGAPAPRHRCDHHEKHQVFTRP